MFHTSGPDRETTERPETKSRVFPRQLFRRPNTVNAQLLTLRALSMMRTSNSRATRRGDKLDKVERDI